MGRPNYSHSKRQRELVKKQKREEKLAKKLEKKNATPGDATEGITETGETGEAGEDVEQATAPDPVA